MKHTIKAMVCLLLCSSVFTACTNTAPKTESTATTDSIPKPDHMAIQKAMAGNIHEFAAYSALGNGALQALSIQFGSKGGDDNVPCNPGPGICNVDQNLGGTGTADTSLVSQGTFYMYMFKANLQSSNPKLYELMNSTNFSGVITWPSDYTVPTEIAASMGVNPPNTITINQGMPVAYGASVNPQIGDIAMYPLGAIPGNQGWLSLSNCTPINDSVSGVTLNFSATQTGSAVQAYSAIGIIPGATWGFLTLYMNTQSFLSQPGICPSCLPCTAPAINLSVLSTTTTYTFSDPATAASMSVPLNSTIAPSASIVGYFGEWCAVSFIFNIPGDGSTALKNAAAARLNAAQKK
jgi:hypothetical protein